MMKFRWFLRFALAWLLGLSIGGACLTLPVQDGAGRALTKRQGGTGPRVVYRGDRRPPEVIMAQGGFLPRPSPEGSDAGYSLDHHVKDWTMAEASGELDSFDSRFVSTSKSPNMAQSFADRVGGYVYCIKTTPNAVDVNESYLKRGTLPPFKTEEEFAFFGGISWKQVKMYKTKHSDWEINGEYNMEFNKFQAAGAHPQLLERDASTSKSAALQLMSSDENAKAKEFGAAPGFCPPLSKRAGLDRRSCEPKFETAKYESKWLNRAEAKSGPNPHEQLIAASLEHSAEDAPAKFLEQEFGRLANKFGLGNIIQAKAKQERLTFAEVKDKLHTSMHRGPTKPGRMSSIRGETALQLAGIGLWAKDVFDSFSTDSTDLSRTTVLTSIVPLVGCGAEGLSDNAHGTPDVVNSVACVAADSLLMSPAWPLGLMLHGFRALAVNPSMDEFRKAFADRSYLYRMHQGQWVQNRNALLDRYGDEERLLRYVGIEFSARALGPAVLATESAGKLREKVLQLSADSGEKVKTLEKLLDLLDSELCTQLTAIKKELESEINNRFDALFEEEYTYFWGNFSKSFERLAAQAEVAGAGRLPLHYLKQAYPRKDGEGLAPGPNAAQFTRPLTRLMMDSLLTCATGSDGKTVVTESLSLGLPAACPRIKDLQLFLSLSDDPGSGTNDKIGASLIGSAGKASLEIASNPDKGFEEWTAVDMRSAFGSDVIDIRGIDTLELTAEGTIPFKPGKDFRLDPFYNDPWKVQGAGPDEKYRLDAKGTAQILYSRPLAPILTQWSNIPDWRDSMLKSFTQPSTLSLE